jgi:hypothetical protein
MADQAKRRAVPKDGSGQNALFSFLRTKEATACDACCTQQTRTEQNEG